MIGIKIATTGVLFMKADTTATGIIIRVNAWAVDLGLPSSLPKMWSSPPVSEMPAATTNKTVAQDSACSQCSEA